jgi:hypothetical protein
MTSTDLFPVPAAHDPGGKVRVRWPIESTVQARFGGPLDCYRYELSEIWDQQRPLALFCMMNPSMAEIRFSDPTLARTGSFTRGWRSKDGGRYGGQLIGNVHAYRATNKLRLLHVDDPVGPENDQALLAMAARAEIVILAYGQPPACLRLRGNAVARMLIEAGHDVRVLATSNDGTPMHPLYLPGRLTPRPFRLEELA